MKIRSLALTLMVAAGALAACHGASPYTPSLGSSGNSTDASPVAAQGFAGARVPAPFRELTLEAAAGTCTLPAAKLPGTYVEMLAAGVVKAGTFSIPATELVRSWDVTTYSVGTPTPKPTPTPKTTPTPKGGPTPKPIAVWVYTGTFTTAKSKQTGCAELIATESGQPLGIEGKDNAISSDSPQIVSKYPAHTKELSFGSVNMTISGLSASGGHGSATLLTTKGKIYDTAVITLTGRVSVKI